MLIFIALINYLFVSLEGTRQNVVTGHSLWSGLELLLA